MFCQNTNQINLIILYNNEILIKWFKNPCRLFGQIDGGTNKIFVTNWFLTYFEHVYIKHKSCNLTIKN